MPDKVSSAHQKPNPPFSFLHTPFLHGKSIKCTWLWSLSVLKDILLKVYQVFSYFSGFQRIPIHNQALSTLKTTIPKPIWIVFFSVPNSHLLDFTHSEHIYKHAKAQPDSNISILNTFEWNNVHLACIA